MISPIVSYAQVLAYISIRIYLYCFFTAAMPGAELGGLNHVQMPKACILTTAN